MVIPHFLPEIEEFVAYNFPFLKIISIVVFFQLSFHDRPLNPLK